MTSEENANLIQILECVGWTGEQITKLQLGIDGRISIEDAANLILENERAKKEKA